MRAGARKLVAAVAGFSLALGPSLLDWPIDPHVSSAYAKGGKGNGGGHGGSHGHGGGSHGSSGGGSSGGGGHSGGGHGGSGGGNGNSGGSHGSSGGNGNSGGGNGNSGNSNSGNHGSGVANSSKARSANAGSRQAKKASQGDNRGQAAKAARSGETKPAAARKAVRRQRPAPSLAQTKAARAVPAPVASPFAVAKSAPRIRQARHEIVVQGLSPKDLANLRRLGFLTLRNFKNDSVARLHLPRGASLTDAKAAIARINPQATVDANHFYYPAGVPCAGSGCVDLALVKWPVAEQATQGCGNVPLIGMVDTAVDLSSPALRGQDIEMLDGTDGTAGGDDEHGTMVASLLVGKPGSDRPGLLPRARLLAVDAFDRNGGPEARSDAATLVDAIDRLVERGVRVINLSLAGPQNAVLGQAIARAQAKGVIVVAAAGNEGPGAEPSYPAAYADVVAVTAVDQQLVVYRRANRGSYIDFAAPGVAVPGDTADGSHDSGTSFAAPFVSAAAALILAGQPELNLTDVSRKLAAGALDLGAPGRDSIYGWGLVQADGLCSRPAPIVANDLGPGSGMAWVGDEISTGGE